MSQVGKAVGGKQWNLVKQRLSKKKMNPQNNFPTLFVATYRMYTIIYVCNRNGIVYSSRDWVICRFCVVWVRSLDIPDDDSYTWSTRHRPGLLGLSGLLGLLGLSIWTLMYMIIYIYHMHHPWIASMDNPNNPNNPQFNDKLSMWWYAGGVSISVTDDPVYYDSESLSW